MDQYTQFARAPGNPADILETGSPGAGILAAGTGSGVGIGFAAACMTIVAEGVQLEAGQIHRME